MNKCLTCESCVWPNRLKCNTCREVEDHLEDYIKLSAKGRDFVRNLLSTCDTPVKVA